MLEVAYTSFFVPPEWIAAHGFRPVRVIPDGPSDAGCGVCVEGMCPYAQAIAYDLGRLGAGAVVFAPSCDQGRRLVEWVEERAKNVRAFLLHVPRVSGNPAARQYFRAEIERLGRWLVRIGGNEPDGGQLSAVMGRFDRARMRLREAAAARRAGLNDMTARDWSEALMRLHRGGEPNSICGFASATFNGRGSIETVRPRIAVLGGPLFAADLRLLDWIEDAGATVALDGSESGERTLPAAFDPVRQREDPVGELVRAYFDESCDVSRKPNDRLFGWVRQVVTENGISGIILRHHVWCDQWLAEVPRLAEATGVPLLVVDSARGDDNRTRTRVEAFVEMLRGGGSR